MTRPVKNPRELYAAGRKRDILKGLIVSPEYLLLHRRRQQLYDAIERKLGPDDQYYLSELSQAELKIQGMIADAFFTVGYADGRKYGRAQRVRKNNQKQKEQQE